MRKFLTVLCVTGLTLFLSALAANAGGTVTKGGMIRDTITPHQAQIYQINVPAWQSATLTVTSDGQARYNFMLLSGNGLVLSNSNGPAATFSFSAAPGASYRLFVTDLGGPAVSPLVVQVK